ncbi:MAG TPA: hypothetical protein VFJ90_15475 [Candidatus Didemnitutus sp.]|nr:hypothetical protein [Candidatus Didemnitutus sp.]
MTDLDCIAQIEARVGRAVPHMMQDGRCVELSLASDDALYHGLIRHHPPAEQWQILQLVCRLTGLRRLNLRRNRVGRLPAEFGRLTELEHVVLGSNELGLVPAELRGMRRLRSLHLGHNDIAELPGWFGELDQLEYLALHKNLRLKNLAPLHGLKRLKNLNLFLLNLLTLPEVLYEFTNLVTLTLWNVAHYPAGLDSFPQLEFFTLSGTPGGKALPPGFTKLPRLRMTRLHQNSIAELPEDLGNLGQLEQISLYQNQLSRLPESMAQLHRLTKVNLGWNCFKQLPEWLGRMERLEWLGIFENPLERPALPSPRPGLQIAREWTFSTRQKLPDPQKL